MSIYRGQETGAVGTVLANIDERFGTQPGKMKEALNSLITPPTYDPALKWGAFELLPVRRKGFSKGLIRIAANRLNTQIFTLGWELPFTNSGKQSVRSPRRSSSTPRIFWSIRAMLEETDLEPNYPKPELTECVLMRNATFTDSCCRRVSLQ